MHWARQRGPAELAASYFTESEAAIFLELAKLHPQLRLFIPGEFVAVVAKRDGRALGEMPRVLLHTEQGRRPAQRCGRSRHLAKRLGRGA